MTSSRNPTLAEKEARRQKLVEHLAELGIKPEEVLERYQKLKDEIRADLNTRLAGKAG